MIRKVLTLLLLVLALIAGGYGGDFLRPEGASHGNLLVEESAADPATPTEPDVATGPLAWMKFSNQFFVPVMRDTRMKALVILTLSIETREDALEDLRKHEHRLRDALLRQLMIEANSGAFDGNYTAEPFTQRLRASLLRAVISAGAEKAEAVLIEDIVMQAQ